MRGFNPVQRYLWRLVIQSAARRGHRLTLTPHQYTRLIKLPCHYCGAAPQNQTKLNRGQGMLLYNGVDRVDNNRGYTRTNVVPCCSACNTMKARLTVAEFLAHVRRIGAYQQRTTP